MSAKETLFDRLNVDTWMLLPKGFDPEPIGEAGEKQGIWGHRTTVARYSGGIRLVLCMLPGAQEYPLNGRYHAIKGTAHRIV